MYRLQVYSVRSASAAPLVCMEARKRASAAPLVCMEARKRASASAAPLVCMEARKRARRSQRIAGQLMNEETVIGEVQKGEHISYFCGEKVLVQMTHFPQCFFLSVIRLGTRDLCFGLPTSLKCPKFCDNPAGTLLDLTGLPQTKHFLLAVGRLV